MAGVVGRQVQFGMGTESTPGTAVAATSMFEIVNLQTNMNEQIFATDGLRGTRSKLSERVRQNTRAPSYTVTMHPNSVELDYLLPLILGGAEVADAFPLAETLSSFTTWIDISTTRYRYLGCMVSSARFYSTQGGPLALDLTVEAMDADNSGTAFASLSISVAAGPYLHADCAATVSASAYEFADVALTVDNMLKVDRFFTGQTRVSLIPTDRTITWELSGPSGDNFANLYGLTASGVACVATYTNGNRSLAFTSNKVSFPRLPPQVNVLDEVMLPLTGTARKDGATLELTTVNDSTG